MRNSCNNTSQINIVTALACEARPLIDHFHLKKEGGVHPYPVYSNENIRLIVSGIGNIRSAAATTYLHTIMQNPPHACFLNMGIAGSQHFTRGELIAANKIVDAESERAYYPSIFLLPPIKQTTLFTHNSPQKTYPDQGVVDMEAVGFFIAAKQLVTQEQIQIIKIISDTSIDEQSNLTRQQAEELIRTHVPTIERVVETLLQFSEKESEQRKTPNYYDDFIDRWHFTTYQRHTLEETLRRWNIVFPSQNPLSRFEETSNAKKIITALNETLSQAEY